MQCPTHKKKLQKLEQISQQKNCNICGRTAGLYCKSCKYLQCQNCRVCSQKHFLLKIVDLNKVKKEYYNNAFSCNSCSKSKTVDDNGIWHCNSCNFDLCTQCVQ